MGEAHAEIVDALRALGITRLVLGIHDVSFPAAAGEDTGRGSPYSKGARDFFAFARELGFDGVQLGPQGQTSLGNMSPYDGSVFSKSVLSVPLVELAGPRYGALLPRAVFDEIAQKTSSRPGGAGRAHYGHAFVVHEEAVARAAASLLRRAASAADLEAAEIAREVRAFEEARAGWLAHDALFEAFAAQNGTDDIRLWPERDRAPDAARIAAVELGSKELRFAYRFGQWVLAREHAELRERLAGLGLRLYGDLQVGLSLRDRWRRDALFLPGFRMGAPPSRTNPEGQPWGYPVLDPRQYLRTDGEASSRPAEAGGGASSRPAEAGGGPLAFLRARIGKMFSEFDGVRIDHPHGLVCPWVYDATLPDPLAAVQAGARLFESPEHPRLGDLAIARRDQIDLAVTPYDDGRVKALEPAQVDLYARLFDVIMDAARAEGRAEGDVVCEVLSTCPRPLLEILRRFDLGRFRVTQKASMTDAADVYRGENAGPKDWTMIGNHDTDPLLRVIDRWQSAGTVGDRAAYLASRLEPDAARRAAFASGLAADPRALATAMFAELFVGPASHVFVFWADLFGERDVYNTPGVVRPENWTMRVVPDFRAVYGERVAAGAALDLPSALAMAMHARGPDFVRAHEGLARALRARAAVRLT